MAPVLLQYSTRGACTGEPAYIVLLALAMTSKTSALLLGGVMALVYAALLLRPLTSCLDRLESILARFPGWCLTATIS